MKIEIIKGTENPVAEFFSSPLETNNERTLKLALEVFTQLANTLKQERDEAREKYDLEAVENMLAINKLCGERDEARGLLRIAVGLLSTQPQFADKHPEDVLDFVKEGVK